MDPNARYYGASANYNKPGGPGLNRRFLVIIGAILLVAVLLFAGFSLFSTLSNGPRDQLATLVARQKSLQVFTSANQSKLTSNQLQKVNSQTSLYMTSDSTSLQKQLALRYGLSEIPKEVTAAEADTSADELTQATQSGKFNEVYKEILDKKITATLTLAESVQQGTTGQLNAALEKTIQSLNTLQAELAASN